MKRIIILSLSFLFCNIIHAKDMTGQWGGRLNTGFQEIFLLFTIENDKIVLDIPAQNVLGMSCTLSVSNEDINITISHLNARFSGKKTEEQIQGRWIQNGMPVNLNLKQIKRFQEPKPPFNYYIEDVNFENKSANAVFGGTLTIPDEKGVYPAVVLISGSGLQDRNSNIFGHKLFWIIADYFAKNGIAVLRFDDRGYGESTGDLKNATTKDFTTDVKCAVDFLKNRKEIDNDKIGLIGHSEGSSIAAMIAANSNDIGYIISMAGSGLRGDKVILGQMEEIFRKRNAPELIIQKQKNLDGTLYDLIINIIDEKELNDAVEKFLDDYIVENSMQSVRQQVVQQTKARVLNPWFLHFIRHNPAMDFEKIKCPVLVLNGDNDTQILSKENLPAIENALKRAGNRNYKIMELEGLSHCFQKCELGLMEEYAESEQTVDPMVLEIMLDWIKEIIK